MARPATERYVHRLVLEQKDRQRRGILEPDRKMHAISAPAPDKSCLYIMVNECKLGITSAALFRSSSLGVVQYDPKEVEEGCLGTQEFIARATAHAIEHSHIPAVQRRYPKPDETPK